MAPDLAIAVIDRGQRWLDPVADTLQQALVGMWSATGGAGQKIKNALHGTWLGHPLHPVLTDLPIGAWTMALVFDTLDRVNGSRRFERAADTAVGVGVATALGAAVSGLTDWEHTDGRSKRTGLVHATMNTSATVCYATSLVLRRRGSRESGRTAALLGFGIAMAAAYLGGYLVYKLRVGVNHADERARPREFVPVLPEAELRAGELRRVEADGVRVLLVRRGDRIFAIGETCSHFGGPLADGKLEGDDTVRCPWHGSRFSLEDGSVIDGPTTFPQPCFEARVRGGQVEVRAASR
jgi:nitrite reductase/ring-hydroxylating ferredoxin subunit/uncharacterized membrane protein